MKDAVPPDGAFESRDSETNLTEVGMHAEMVEKNVAAVHLYNEIASFASLHYSYKEEVIRFAALQLPCAWCIQKSSRNPSTTKAATVTP